MTSQAGPIIEFIFCADQDVTDEFDQWLESHVSKSLRNEGIVDCTVLALADDDTESVRRRCLHFFKNDEALDRFLDDEVGNIESEITTHFGERVVVSSRVLREDSASDCLPGETPDCKNCGARLLGQYCGTCGQRSRGRLISLWELISDAFGDLFELDSRLWRTLIPLMIRPGQLTKDYLQGRRARYMPPFRMYLVLSFLFFIIAFFDPSEKFSLLYEPEPDVATAEIAAEDIADANKVLEELDLGDDELKITINGEDGSPLPCKIDGSERDEMPDWLSRRLTPKRLQHICDQTQIDDGRALANKLIDNIPAALIILLPLMAFVLKALYPLSKRYYVEHLLFFVHFHGFFFLMLSLEILFAQLAPILRIPETAMVLTLVAASFYIPVYLFLSMRRVYGQRRFVTFIKFIALLVAYLAGFTSIMLGALAIAAFSI
jgi:hypothetical protein